MGFISETLRAIYEMGWGNMNGIMDNLMREAGKMGKKVVLEFGDPQMEIVMRDNGQMADKMGKECISIKQALSKDNFCRV